MRSLLFFTVCAAFCTTAFAQAVTQKVKRKGVTPLQLQNVSPESKYNLKQASGKWQEVKRTNSDDDLALQFKDSLQLIIRNDTVTVRDAVHLTMIGEVYLNAPNSAQIAGDVYTIKTLDENQFVLDDGAFVRHMQKVSSFYYESLPTTAVKPDLFGDPISADLNSITGKWIVYRGQALPGTAHDRERIRSIHIQSMQSDNNYAGQVGYADAERSQIVNATFSVINNELHIVTDKNSWVLSVYKADGNELVFGNKDGLMYYSKKM